MRAGRGILFLWRVALGALLLAGIGCQKGSPNVLLISLDACRARNLGSYGYSRETSPFLDQIAAGGIRFANAFVNAHGTAPSHTTILTSLYQESHRVQYTGLSGAPAKDAVPETATMLQEVLRDHGYVTLAVTGGGQMGRPYGFDRGFVEFDDDGGGVRSGTRKLVKLIRKHIADGSPLFAFYHTYEIHSPYFPPGQYRRMFGDFGGTFAPSSGNLLRSARTARRDLSDADLASLVAWYDGGIRYTDDVLKTMFDELEAIGFFENYLLVITSDHGEEFAEHGGLMHRGLLYDELLHVPLIVAGTNLPRGKVDERMVSSVDIATTILHRLALLIPDAMEGRNLLAPPISQRQQGEAVFSQYGHFRFSIRTPGWKLIENARPRPSMELYDLHSDPGEHSNLYGERADIASPLRERLDRWRENQALLQQEPGKVNLTDEQLERLRGLGYVGGEEPPP